MATLVITADKGLAGGYNHFIIRFAEESCPQRGSILLLIGAVGKRYFIEKDYRLLEDFNRVGEGTHLLRGQGSRRLRGVPVSFGRHRRVPRDIPTRMHSTVKLEPEE